MNVRPLPEFSRPLMSADFGEDKTVRRIEADAGERSALAERFGIVAVDHDDPALTRRPRESAQMYREIIEANAITPGVVEKYSPGVL